MRILLSIAALFLLTILILISIPNRMTGQEKSQEPARVEPKDPAVAEDGNLSNENETPLDKARPARKQLSLQFTDLDGDGINDNAPDHDHDGIPNGLDSDYKRGMGMGMRRGLHDADSRRQLREALSDRKHNDANGRPPLRHGMAQRIRR